MINLLYLRSNDNSILCPFVTSLWDFREAEVVSSRFDDKEWFNDKDYKGETTVTPVKGIAETIRAVEAALAKSGISDTCYSIHTKSVLRRLETLSHLRPDVDSMPSTEMFGDIVEMFNYPAIITYEQRISFNPKLITSLTGLEDSDEIELVKKLCLMIHLRGASRLGL